MLPIEDDLVRDTRPIVLAVFGAVGLGTSSPARMSPICPRASRPPQTGARGARRRRGGTRAFAPPAAHRDRRARTAWRRGRVLAAAAVPVLGRVIAQTFPRVDAPRLDILALAFAVAASSASSLLFD